MVATFGNDNYNHKAAGKTYFPNGYSMSLAMRRARAQYFWRNVRGMLAAAGFIGLVYTYSIKAVAQDDFSDLADLIPNAEERKAMSSIEDINAARAGRRIPAASALSSTSSPSASTPTATTPLGADFGLARRTMYYWPSGGLVQGPSALDAKVPAGGVDWSAGKLV